MADLSGRRDERAQILLLGAFALAALFVTLALILNAVIYTENLATRADSRTSDAVAHSKSVERGTVDLLEYVNEYNTTNYSHLRNELGTGFVNFTEALSRFRLTSGVVIGGTVRTEFEGTWLTQTNASRNFTNRNNTAVSWSPVNGSANGARAFRMNVTAVSASLGPNNFSVRASNGTHNWSLAVGTNDINVTDATGNTSQCSIGAAPVWINVSEGRVGGADCAPLDFGADLDTISSIEFHNADQIKGSYRLLVNNSLSDIDDPEQVDFALNSTNDGPFKEPALYGAVVGIEYQTTSLLYRSDRRVVPGEIDG
ncbi:MAG: hypothetical protein V5A43_05820 [Haloarculaceae archaeon]